MEFAVGIVALSKKRGSSLLHGLSRWHNILEAFTKRVGSVHMTDDDLERLRERLAPQENLLVHSGTGNAPSVWYKAISWTLKVRNPYDFLAVNFALVLKPSTVPLETCPLARNQFTIRGWWFLNIRATFFIGSSRERKTRVIQRFRNFSAQAGLTYSQKDWKSSLRI